ncbi:hypothetical protein BDR22DRAFT_224762 [Usnea florida]
MAQIATFPVESKRERKATAEASLEKLESLLDTVTMTPCYNDESLPFSLDFSGTATAISEILHGLMPQLRGNLGFRHQSIRGNLQKILDVGEGLEGQKCACAYDSAAILRLILKVLQSFALALRDFGQRQLTTQRSLSIRRRLIEAIPKLRGLREIFEKLPQNPSTPSTVISILSELNSILESLWSPVFDRHKHRLNDPYSSHTRHRIPAKLYQSPEAKVPPDRSSTRNESDFCSSITTVQRMSPLRLFKIRWNLVPIIFPNL